MPAANTVAEDAVVGTVVGDHGQASDADATTNTITYSLDDDAGGLFAIDANTGMVTVAGGLDYETATSHNITIRATSTTDRSPPSSFTINVTDVNESGISAISDTDAAADFVLENSASGHVGRRDGLRRRRGRHRYGQLLARRRCGRTVHRSTPTRAS